MSSSRQDDHQAGGRQVLDDATAEELLAGRSRPGAGDLDVLSAFLDEVRSLGREPAPRPSPALARVLAGDRAADAGTNGAAPGRRRPLWTFLTPGAVSSMWAGGGLAKAALVFLVVTASVTAAGAARVLPGPAQQLVGRALEVLTPFEFSEDGDADGESRPGRGPAPDGTVHASAPGPGEGPDQPASAPEAGQLGGTGPVPPSPSTGARHPSTEPGKPPPHVRPDDPRQFRGRSGRGAPAQRSATLTGAAQRPGPGDPDGAGTALVSLDVDRRLLCVTVTVTGVAPVTGVHIHQARPPAVGPLVVSVTLADVSGCTSVDAGVLAELDRKPRAYYVEVHTTEFPGGALRGQLRR